VRGRSQGDTLNVIRRQLGGEQMDALTGRGIHVLIPPDGAKRQGARPGWNSGRYVFM
jgi:hypothetical protein